MSDFWPRIVERELPEAGRDIRNPSALRWWLLAYAAATSTVVSFEKIRDAATSGQGDKPSRQSTRHYTDTGEQLCVLDPAPAWLASRNQLGRLTAGPKHQLADPALAASLLSRSSSRRPSTTATCGTCTGSQTRSATNSPTLWCSPLAARHTAAPTASRSSRWHC